MADFAAFAYVDRHRKESPIRMKKLTGFLVVFAFVLATVVGTVAMADKPLKPIGPGPDKEDCYYVAVGFYIYHCCPVNDKVDDKCWLVGPGEPI
jgi:hypothetical protein